MPRLSLTRRKLNWDKADTDHGPEFIANGPGAALGSKVFVVAKREYCGDWQLWVSGEVECRGTLRECFNRADRMVS